MMLLVFYQFHSINCGFHPFYGRRVAEVEICIFLAYLRFDVTVFFKRETVVAVAYQKNSSDSPEHKLVGILTWFHASMLYEALIHHSVGDLDEACYVGTLDIIDVSVFFLTVFQTGFVDGFHYAMQMLINFFGRPLLTY